MRVMIVDDDEDARILLERALAKGGLALEVVSAVDGRDALDRIVIDPPHAVITDVMMPRMNGLALCAALRAAAATAHVPVMMVTALEDEDDRAAGLAAGADAYLTKPFSWNELSERLEALLHARYGAEAAVLLRSDPA